MVDVLNERDAFLTAFTEFEKARSGVDSAAVRRLRRAAMDQFVELGFPTARTEDWRFTNVGPIARTGFVLGEPSAAADVEGRLAQAPAIEQRLVFVNGRLDRRHSTVRTMPSGVVIDSLANVLRDHPDLVEPHLAQHAESEENAFTALSTAFLADGACICLPKGVVLEAPLHLVFVTCGIAATMAHPRNLFVLGPSSRATIVETYISTEGEMHFTNPVTEIVLGENAVLDHCKLQRESTRSFHVATTQVHQARASNFRTHYLGFGGVLVRNEVRTVLDGAGCEATVNGLYMASGTQHMDNLTVIDHAQPHCPSHELYKGILGGKAHGVFNGKIFVRQDAQKTDAKQTNQTLLLSDDATINTKPQLEIFADDVKCTHGATVGQLDAESLFYMRTRGLGQKEAQALLTFAFANDIIARIRVPALRRQLEEQLLAAHRLPVDFAVEELA